MSKHPVHLNAAYLLKVMLHKKTRNCPQSIDRETLFPLQVIECYLEGSTANVEFLEAAYLQSTLDPSGYRRYDLSDYPVKSSLIWLPEDAPTGGHDHRQAYSFGRVLQGEILERKYGVSNGKLEEESAILLRSGEFFQTHAYQCHELEAKTNALVVVTYVWWGRF